MNRKEEDCLSLDPEYVLRLPDASLSFDVGLTAEERKAFVNLLDFADGQLDVSLVGKSPVFQAHVLLSGNALVRDSHDGKERALPIEDGVDLVLDTKDDEESDLPLERDGTFHLRGTFLSLLHDAIPANYSEVPLTRIETDDYVLMSEDEYERSRKKTAFSALDGFFDETDDKKDS